MVQVFAINALVSFMLAVAMWTVWRMDRTHLFVRDISLMQVSYLPVAAGYFLIGKEFALIHHVGVIITSMSVAAVFTAAFSAALRLSAYRASTTRLVTVFSVVSLCYVYVLQESSFKLAGVIGFMLFLSTGLMIFFRLFRQDTASRVVGICFVLLGCNALLPALLGRETGLTVQFSAAIVIRTTLCISIMFMALTRSRERETGALLRFQQLTDNSQQGILVINQYEVFYANAAALRIFGLTQLSEMQAAGPYIGITKPAVRDKSFALIGQVIEGKLQQVSGEAMRFSADGSRKYLQMTGWRADWEGRQAAHILITDHTAAHKAALEIKALQEQAEVERDAFAERIKNNLLQANSELEIQVAQRTRELQEASAAKDQFLANMSHELRTPMNAVLGLLRLIKGTDLTHRQSDYIDKTVGAAKSLLRLLNDVLDFSKIAAGKLELEKAPFSMETLLQELSVILSMNARQKNVEVLFTIDHSIPAMLLSDAFRIKQVLINLCMNAVKFTEQGEVCLRVTVLNAGDTSCTLRFSVSDTGIGISPPDQIKIFEIFSQADNSFTRRYGGSGLGLPISRQLVELMGGELSVSSALGQGSTFEFELTLDLPDPDTQATAKASIPGPVRTLNVLVVDDHPGAMAVLSRMCQDLGHKTVWAAGGERAVAMAGQKHYDAIVLDENMPGMDGWKTAEKLRGLKDGPGRPAVLLASGAGRQSLEQRSSTELHLIDAFISKPLTHGVLQDNLNLVTSGRSNLRHSGRNTSGERKRLDGMHILVVDDNALNQTVASELLRAQGATVEVAANGQAGVDAVRSSVQSAQPFDAVLMDMQMPVMDGCTATGIIRTELKMTELPIIAMTANTLAADRQACMDAGMNAHVGKPFDLNYLVEVLLTYRRTNALPSVAMALPALMAPPPKPAMSVEPTADASELDVEGALERIGDDADLYRALLDAFVKEITPMADQLDALVAAANWAAVNRLMHSLKGNSSTVGATAMESVAREAEQASEGEASGFVAGNFSIQVREALQLTLAAAERAAAKLP